MRWTQMVLLTRAPACGRRSRVVLTPRRRRQVSGGNSADDGDKKARSPGRARRKPLKPLRAGMPGYSGATVVTNSCAFYTLRTRLRVHWAPGIPRARCFQGGKFMHNSGASRRGNAESYLDVIARSDLSAAVQRAEGGSDEAIHTPSFRGAKQTRNLGGSMSRIAPE